MKVKVAKTEIVRCRDLSASARMAPDSFSLGWSPGISMAGWSNAVMRHVSISPGRGKMKMIRSAAGVGASSKMANYAAASICIWPTTPPFGPRKQSEVLP